VLRLSRREAQERADGLLERVGLAEKRTQYPDSLSGGQQQRVAIVRALAMQPRLLLLDEITSALDPELVAEVLTIVRELAHEGMTMLLATHEMSFAREVSSRVCFLDAGQICEQGRQSRCSPSRPTRAPRRSSSGSSPPGGCDHRPRHAGADEAGRRSAAGGSRPRPGPGRRRRVWTS